MPDTLDKETLTSGTIGCQSGGSVTGPPRSFITVETMEGVEKPVYSLPAVVPSLELAIHGFSFRNTDIHTVFDKRNNKEYRKTSVDFSYIHIW